MYWKFEVHYCSNFGTGVSSIFGHVTCPANFKRSDYTIGTFWYFWDKSILNHSLKSGDLNFVYWFLYLFYHFKIPIISPKRLQYFHILFLSWVLYQRRDLRWFWAIKNKVHLNGLKGQFSIEILLCKWCFNQNFIISAIFSHIRYNFGSKWAKMCKKNYTLILLLPPPPKSSSYNIMNNYREIYDFHR